MLVTVSRKRHRATGWPEWRGLTETLDVIALDAGARVLRATGSMGKGSGFTSDNDMPEENRGKQQTKTVAHDCTDMSGLFAPHIIERVTGEDQCDEESDHDGPS